MLDMTNATVDPDHLDVLVEQMMNKYGTKEHLTEGDFQALMGIYSTDLTQSGISISFLCKILIVLLQMTFSYWITFFSTFLRCKSAFEKLVSTPPQWFRARRIVLLLPSPRHAPADMSKLYFDFHCLFATVFISSFIVFHTLLIAVCFIHLKCCCRVLCQVFVSYFHSGHRIYSHVLYIFIHKNALCKLTMTLVLHGVITQQYVLPQNRTQLKRVNKAD